MLPHTPHLCLCVTTNGIVKTDGRAVMGAGVAKAFAGRYPILPAVLGSKLLAHGNQVHYLGTFDGVSILSFPTKHHWRSSSDLALISSSAQVLAETARVRPEYTFVVTPPGCGLGGLSWNMVRHLVEQMPDNCWVIDRC